MLKITFIGGAAIAQWIRLRLPSCHHGFKSQAHHLRFYHLYYLCCICHLKRTKNKQKEWPIFKITFSMSTIYVALVHISNS